MDSHTRTQPYATPLQTHPHTHKAYAYTRIPRLAVPHTKQNRLNPPLILPQHNHGSAFPFSFSHPSFFFSFLSFSFLFFFFSFFIFFLEIILNIDFVQSCWCTYVGRSAWHTMAPCVDACARNEDLFFAMPFRAFWISCNGNQLSLRNAA